MKKINVILLLIVTVHVTLAQQKNDYYFDSNYTPISKKLFEENNDIRYNLNRIVENDTAYLHFLIPRQTYGRLKKGEFSQFRELLSKTTETSIDSTKTILINFFPNESKVIGIYLNQKAFMKKIQKNPKLIQFYMTERGFTYKNKRVIPDKYDIVKRLFFPIEIPGGSFVIIKPNGNYYRYYGEYGLDSIFPKVQEKWPTEE